MEPVLWTEDIKWKKELLIDAQSFNDWVFQVLPQVKNFVPGLWGEPEMTKVHIGEKIFALRKLPTMGMSYIGPRELPAFLRMESDFRMAHTRLPTYQPGGKRGDVMFTDEVLIPVLVQPDPHAKLGFDVWMSLAPNDILTQRPGLRHGRGNVLIGGLGMGWFTRRILERKQVKHVTVVDSDWDVLVYFGEQLKREFKDRLTLVHDDAYNQAFGEYDSVLFDIWSSVNDSPYDKRWQEIRESHPNAWGWGFLIQGEE